MHSSNGNAATIDVSGNQDDKSTLQVIRMDPSADPRWEDFVRRHPDGLIYQRALWLKLLERSYRVHGEHLACIDATGTVRGVLPLQSHSGLLTGKRLASVPFSPIAGPLADSTDVVCRLLDGAKDHARDLNISAIQIRRLENGEEIDGIYEDFAGGQYCQTFIRDLPDNVESLRFGNSRNHNTVKRMAKQATDHNVEVRQAVTRDELRIWYDLYLETMRTHIVPPRPLRFFETAWDLLRPAGMMRLFLAEQEKDGERQIVAGSMILYDDRTATYAYNGRREAALRTHANDLLHWEIIHDACAKGFARYDMGEAEADQPGLQKYKRKWGAEPKWIYRHHYPGENVREDRSMNSYGRFQRASGAVWRRLPLPVTRVAGTLAYRLMQ